MYSTKIFYRVNLLNNIINGVKNYLLFGNSLIYASGGGFGIMKATDIKVTKCYKIRLIINYRETYSKKIIIISIPLKKKSP